MTDQTPLNTIPSPDDIASAISRLRKHYAEVVLPMWQTSGFHSKLNLPHEAVLVLDTLPAVAPDPTRFRAMACARQLYVFSANNDKVHADRLFGALKQHFHDPESGGFFFSVNAEGIPLDTDKDLYTHAFIVFACAAYLQRFGAPEALHMISDTVKVIASQFTTEPVSGLPNAVLSRDYSVVRTTPRQNPLMHLTEAYLLARDAFGMVENGMRIGDDELSAAWFDRALEDLLKKIGQTFVDPASGCILELPLADKGSWSEPGHQFEWFYLAYGSGHFAFEASNLRGSLWRAFDFAQTHGVDVTTGGVAAKLDRQGALLDDTQRIWAQTEYLRALNCHPDPAQRLRLLTQIQFFEARFLHAGGWNEVVSADNRVVRADMPSTTPYHLASSYYALS